MVYEESKSLCCKALEEEHTSQYIGKTKKKVEGKYCIPKVTYIDCTPDTEPF